ncbi:hypothetical protein CGCSCA1_v008198 [Colletotrichum siamense]|nr:hypothetical protein CGCSCA1_v008198 [Colletotrichum siamense]
MVARLSQHDVLASAAAAVARLKTNEKKKSGTPTSHDNLFFFRGHPPRSLTRRTTGIVGNPSPASTYIPPAAVHLEPPTTQPPLVDAAAAAHLCPCKDSSFSIMFTQPRSLSPHIARAWSRSGHRRPAS